MKNRKFGKLGIERSAFGIGCMRLPTVNVDGHNEVDEAEAIKIIRTAIDGGVTYVDTAYPYHEGKSEIIVGKALRDGYRERVSLATKLPIWSVKEYDDMPRIFNEQCKKLQTEHIDFYLVHALNLGEWKRLAALGVTDFLNSLKASGKITYACFSFHDNYAAFDEIIHAYDWDMCQLQFNFLDVEDQAGMKGVELARSLGIPVVVMEGLRGGKFASAPDNVAQMYRDYPVKRTPVEWAFHWLCNVEGVATILSGVSDMQQVTDNLRIFSEACPGTMTDDDMKFMMQVRAAYLARTRVGCTACKYCMPCPAGVNIPGIFAAWNGVYQFGGEEGYSWDYDQMKKNGNGADRCIECGKCENVCPQHLEIRELLKAADKAMKC